MARLVKLICRSRSRLTVTRLLHGSTTCSTDEVSPHGPAYTTIMSQASSPATPDQLRPIYRVLNSEGVLLDPLQDPKIGTDDLMKMYKRMRILQKMDEYLFSAQRMGLMSFYLENTGEEGTHFGSAAALSPEDVIYGQYREAGVLLWRGFTIDDMMNQCFSNKHEGGKGRQMPVHYGSKELNFHYISSPLATQMPQAPGYAYGLKLSGSKNCVVVYFGDGSAQAGDSHAAMNFAATLKCPVIFFCRNNGIAISTPVEDQYAGDGIVVRGPGYGMESLRVDGNDVFAVYNATSHARHVCVEEHRPVLIEVMTYRLGNHSSSDDQTLYRDMSDVEFWKNTLYPAERLMKYLFSHSLLNEEQNEQMLQVVEDDVKTAFHKARKVKKPALNHLFTDVYDKLPAGLEKQRQQMWDHLDKYGSNYKMDNFEPSHRNDL